MLTETQYAAAAASVPCDVPAVKTVEAVESTGNGFLPDGRPKILFEAHIFGSRTGHRFDNSHPTVSAPSWDVGKKYYLGGAAEYGRLAEASLLNSAAARESCSWGDYQVMGFNWLSLKYPSIDAFVDNMKLEAGQLDAFLRYVRVNDLGRYMRDFGDIQSCKAFAEGYNGSGAIGVYGQKIFETYAHFLAGGVNRPFARTLSMGMQGDDVKTLQMVLHMNNVDGDFGPATHRAVQEFQHAKGLVRDGIVGAATRQALGL